MAAVEEIFYCGAAIEDLFYCGGRNRKGHNRKRVKNIFLFLYCGGRNRKRVKHIFLLWPSFAAAAVACRSGCRNRRRSSRFGRNRSAFIRPAKVRKFKNRRRIWRLLLGDFFKAKFIFFKISILICCWEFREFVKIWVASFIKI